MDVSTENLVNTTESLTNGLEATGESSSNENNRSSGIREGESSTSSSRRNHKETVNILWYDILW